MYRNPEMRHIQPFGLSRFMRRKSAWWTSACALGAIQLSLAAVACAIPQAALAQDAGATGTGLNYNLIDLIKFGGWVGYVIIVLSVVAVALVVEYAMSIRLGALVPPKDIEELGGLIARGEHDAIVGKLEDPTRSFLTDVIANGVKHEDRGYDAIIKGMEDAADERTGKLLRKIEHLNIIANIAPMLGLLGTVMGMVNSFNQISVSVGGVDPRRLAAGIFEALMTTVMGLIVAIPALYAFGIFRNRVDAIVSEAASLAEDMLRPLLGSSGTHRQ